MFGLFASQHHKTRRLAADWLELADKVFNYRRDVLPAGDLAALQAAAGDVRRMVREKADTARLKLGIDGLEAVLRRTGGSHYPKSGLVENVEFFIVAAIVILGLRAFYVQPFKIPTNSMWPSYYGMTGQVYATRAEEPSALRRAFDLAAVGASARRVDAPVDGEVMLPLGGGRGVVAYQEEAGRSWLVLPARLRHYRIFVGERPVDVRVPLDFDMDWVLRDTFFPGDTRSLGEIVNAKRESGELVAAQVNTPSGVQRAYFLRTGKMLKAGDRVVSFDILTGDQLFVDRMSYHFVRPQVGQGFVFRTDNLESRYMVDAAGKPVESYYIKRLVGVPGDTLRIADYTLYRNGEPITGSPAFDKNARRADRYVGYRPEGLFKDGAEVVIAPGQYLPLGDNSANSLDGRYWGTVAAADVVGRPLFIYYPFTNRWGVAP
jgi:signal peptidase I